MKKDENPLNPESLRNLNSIRSRTGFLIEENNLIEDAFMSRELFWNNQEERFKGLMDSLNVDLSDVKRNFSENVMLTERIVVDFRNRVKTEKVDLLKRNVESWNLDQFVTKKRFYELMILELKSAQRKKV